MDISKIIENFELSNTSDQSSYHHRLRIFLKDLSQSRKAENSAIIDYVNFKGPSGERVGIPQKHQGNSRIIGNYEYFGDVKTLKNTLKFNNYIDFVAHLRQGRSNSEVLEIYPEKRSYDFILCLLSDPTDIQIFDDIFKIQNPEFVLNPEFKIRYQDKNLINALFSLSIDGILFTKLQKHHFHEDESGFNFIKLLANNGFYCSFFSIGWFNDYRNNRIQINTDEKIGDNETILVGFQRKKVKNTFVSILPKGGLKEVRTALKNVMNLSEVKPEIIITNFNKNKGKNIYEGMWIEDLTLPSIYALQFNERKSRLYTAYKTIPHIKIVDVIDNLVPRTIDDSFSFDDGSDPIFQEIPNSLTLLIFSESLAKKGYYFLKNSQLKKTLIGAQGLLPKRKMHLAKLVFIEEIVLSGYVELFLSTRYGSFLLRSISKSSNPENSGTFFNQFLKSFQNYSIPVPPLKDQINLIEAQEKLEELESVIKNLKQELVLHPNQGKTVLGKFESMMKPLKEVTAEDEILELCKRGEGKKIEFKETFEKDISDKNIPSKTLKRESIKQIAAFINTEGGTLLIGVNDDGEIKGIEEDIFKSRDSYLLKFKDGFRDEIGKEWNSNIDFEIYEVQAKLILRVVCKRSESSPCYMKNGDCFVRMGPSAEPFSPKEWAIYTRDRWPS